MSCVSLTKRLRRARAANLRILFVRKTVSDPSTRCREHRSPTTSYDSHAQHDAPTSLSLSSITGAGKIQVHFALPRGSTLTDTERMLQVDVAKGTDCVNSYWSRLLSTSTVWLSTSEVETVRRGNRPTPTSCMSIFLDAPSRALEQRLASNLEGTLSIAHSLLHALLLPRSARHARTPAT